MSNRGKRRDKWVWCGMLTVFLVSSLTWWLNWDRLPHTIRIAAGYPGGLYHRLGKSLEDDLRTLLDHAVEIIPTKGSVQNREFLLDSVADAAVIQHGSVDLADLAPVTPLYEDIVHILVRKGSGITQPKDLAGKAVALGPLGSGMRVNAERLIERFGIVSDQLRCRDSYFLELLTKPEIDAAIVTTGVLNPDLRKVLRSEAFDLLPITHAHAIALTDPFFHLTEIPRGLYCEHPALPDTTIQTVATTALLVVRKDASPLMVTKFLEGIYEKDLRHAIPTLITKEDASSWPLPGQHTAAQKYFDPFGGIDLLASFMESIAAAKELLFALGALAYLLWSSWKDRRSRQHEREIQAIKNQLDSYLDETVRIEKAQMASADPVQLEAYLDEVTTIKLRAIEELTHEDLRGDRHFLIFLTQCANLIRKIQEKLQHYSRPVDVPVVSQTDETERPTS